MKYYILKQSLICNGRVTPEANFKDSSEEENFIKISEGSMLNDVPIFDYFYLESFDKKKYWEWCLLDMYKFTAEASWMGGAFLISKKLKNIFEQYKLSIPHNYYKSILLYKGERLDYYIFQFTGDLVYKEITKYINFKESKFMNPSSKELESFIDIDDYGEKSEKLYFEKKTDYVKHKLVLKEELDFLPMQSFFEDNLVSEKLKQAIEDNGITGFEFSELDYEVIVEK